MRHLRLTARLTIVLLASGCALLDPGGREPGPPSHKAAVKHDWTPEPADDGVRCPEGEPSADPGPAGGSSEVPGFGDPRWLDPHWAEPGASGGDRPADQLGPGQTIPVLDPETDLGSLLGQPGMEGAVSAVVVFLDGWRQVAMRADPSLVHQVSLPGCNFCADVAAREEGIDVAGAEVHLTFWLLGGSHDDEAVLSVALNVVTLVRGTIAEDVEHVHVTQDEDRRLDVLVRRVEGEWRIAGIDGWPWEGV